MASEKKKRKTAKRLHPSRGGNWLKEKGDGKGVKGISFFTPSQRQLNNRMKP